MNGRMQSSGFSEFTPFTGASAIWGQSRFLVHVASCVHSPSSSAVAMAGRGAGGVLQLGEPSLIFQFSSVPWLSRVRLFATPWTAACQASLSITNFQSSLKLMPIESVMPSNHLTLCRPLLLLPSIFPSIRVFTNESVPRISWPKDWSVSASASVLPMNAQDWFPLGGTGWLSLQSQGLSRVFSDTTVQKHPFFGAQLSSQSLWDTGSRLQAQ